MPFVRLTQPQRAERIGMTCFLREATYGRKMETRECAEYYAAFRVQFSEFVRYILHPAMKKNRRLIMNTGDTIRSRTALPDKKP